MAISFNANGVYNLNPISLEYIPEDVLKILISQEKTFYAFETIRDILVFTNKRIITYDAIGITGRMKEIGSIPYSKIQYFTFTTSGPGKIDTKLKLTFTNDFTATFEFGGDYYICKLAKFVSERVFI